MKKINFALTQILILAAAGALHAQTVTLSPSSLSFSALAGGSVQSATLGVSNNSGATGFIAFTGNATCSNNTWLKINGANSTALTSVPAVLTITADPTGLPAGTCAGSISIYAVGPSGQSGPTAVSVTFAVGAIGVNPSTLAFSYQIQGGQAPAPQNVTLTSAVASTPYTVVLSPANYCTWLTPPANGTAPGTLALTPIPGLIPAAPGAYACTVTITPTTGPAAPAIVTATLTVTPEPTVTISPTSIGLQYQIGGATGSTNAASLTMTLSNPGSVPLYTWINPNGVTWLQPNPTSGMIPANGSTQVTFTYATSSNLPASTTPYQGTIKVNVLGADNSSTDVPVSLLVSSQPLLNLPTTPLTFTYQVGGSVPAAQSVLPTTTSTGQTGVLLSAPTTTGGSWLVVPQIAQTGTPFAVSLNASVLSGLAPGTYNGAISAVGISTANATQSAPLRIPVTLTVTNDPSAIATFGGCSQGVSGVTCPMNFAYEVGQNNPISQQVTVTSTTGAALTITPDKTMSSQAACGTNWLSVGPVTTSASLLGTQSISSSAFTVSVNPASIVNGTTCNGTLRITATNPATGNALPNSPLSIPVTLYVNNAGMLVANPIALNSALGLEATDIKALMVASTGTSTADQFAFSVSSPAGDTWLHVYQNSTLTGSVTNPVSVLVNSHLMPPGTYNSQITITATGATVLNSPLTVPVTMTVAGPTMTVSPTSTLTFAQTLGIAAPQPKQLTVSTSGADIAFAVSGTMDRGSGWLTVTPGGTATSSTPATVQVSVNGNNLPAGTYTGTVTVTATTPGVQGSPATIQVSFVVSPGTLSVSTTSLTFNAAQGGTAQSQSLSVNGVPGGLNFTTAASVSAPWLSVSAASGTTPATLQITANPAGLQPAQYAGTVTITATGATGSPQIVNVTLNVAPAQTLTATPATLNFSYVIGGSTAQPQTVQLAASGGAAGFTASVSSGATWLQVLPATGSTPATLSISVSPSGLAANNYTGTISITSPASVSTTAATITVNLAVTAVPKPVIAAVQNAASAVVGAVVPGENIALYGTGIGPATLTFGAVANGLLANIAGNTQVLFDGRPAPVYYASTGQTSVFVPYGIGGQTTTRIQVSYQGVLSDAIPYNVVAAAPGVYTMTGNGSGPAVAWDYDTAGTYTGINSAANRAVKGGIVSLYVTGEGATNAPPNLDGMAVTTLYKPLAVVTATVGGVPATVDWYGSAPGSYYGVMQVNVRIPAGAPSGASVPVVITVGTTGSQTGATLAIQ